MVNISLEAKGEKEANHEDTGGKCLSGRGYSLWQGLEMLSVNQKK